MNETSPDAIVMDISLQGNMDGIKTAKIIKEKLNIPIIFLTAYSDKKVLERIVPLEPTRYILKPFSDNDLRIALKPSLDENYRKDQMIRKSLMEITDVS